MPAMRTTLSTGVASCVMLLPACRPSADLATPEDGRRVSPDLTNPFGNSKGECKPCATPKPPPGSPDDHDPPVILGARFIARDRVQLTFSEPLGSVEGVNPRQFRLSRAYSSLDSGYRNYASGYYYDIAGTDVYEQPLVVVELELYAEQPEVLALSLNRPVPVEICDELAQRKADIAVAASDPANTRRGQIGLFLHYTSRGSVGVRDKVNNPLGDIGADWALNFGSRHKQVYGGEPVTRLDLLPELACPDASMNALGGPPGPT
jgi:hypothetical protein